MEQMRSANLACPGQGGTPAKEHVAGSGNNYGLPYVLALALRLHDRGVYFD